MFDTLVSLQSKDASDCTISVGPACPGVDVAHYVSKLDTDTEILSICNLYTQGIIFVPLRIHSCAWRCSQRVLYTVNSAIDPHAN